MRFEEHKTQAGFIARCWSRYPDLLVFAIPNGGSREIREARRLKAEGVRPGIPDIAVAKVMLPWHGLFIEFKSSTGSLSKAQRQVRNRLVEEGYKVTLARSVDEAMEQLDTYLNPTPEKILKDIL